jgi:uncharacterized protein YndB with AHSA1/START domain
MKNTGNLKVEMHGDRAVLMTRIFDAPRQMVWDAFSKPELLQRWFGPRGYTLPVCDVDHRVGGGFRFVIARPDGEQVGMHATFRELHAPERSVHVESFDNMPGESTVTAIFAEANGKTTLTATVEYPSREVRDMVAPMMEPGAAESYDKLAELLAEAN